MVSCLKNVENCDMKCILNFALDDSNVPIFLQQESIFLKVLQDIGCLRPISNRTIFELQIELTYVNEPKVRFKSFVLNESK